MKWLIVLLAVAVAMPATANLDIDRLDEDMNLLEMLRSLVIARHNPPCWRYSNDPDFCSGHGTCEQHVKIGAYCHCDKGYSGSHCEKKQNWERQMPYDDDDF